MEESSGTIERGIPMKKFVSLLLVLLLLLPCVSVSAEGLANGKL